MYICCSSGYTYLSHDSYNQVQVNCITVWRLNKCKSLVLWIRIILQRLTTDGSQCVQLYLTRLGFQRYCKVLKRHNELLIDFWMVALHDCINYERFLLCYGYLKRLRII
ncbi:hypothetical protein T07_8622 [Trichinella nelsoni]|uniref:Uncharacterized protein n=1 Tax=Trichinella nelsoni TaxID=6336 RepID=A0A0V0SH24_9BILA|nr:hypothetical protein T07_8622 [Trichinella nelsoni]